MTQKRKIIVIGGSASGPKAAAKARRIDNNAEVVIMQKDADFLRNVRDEGKIKKAVVIGGGLIGIETCEALQLAGIEITVIELLPQLLTFLDLELAKLVENHVKVMEGGIMAWPYPREK